MLIYRFWPHSFGSLVWSEVHFNLFKISTVSRGTPFCNIKLVFFFFLLNYWNDWNRFLFLFFITVELLKKRTEPFTSYNLLEIKEDVGTCWEDLGQALGINLSILQNLKDDYRTNREKANEVLQIWMEKNGTDATVGCLASLCKLMQIGHKRIAEKLLGM